MRATVLDILFEPLEMSNLTLKNRFFMAPIGTGYNISKLTGCLAARARGGAALITTGETCVHLSGRAGLANEMLIESDDDIKPLAGMATEVRKAGAKIVLQLNHAGRYSPGEMLGRKSVAPSPIMSGYTGETPRELTTMEVDDLVIAFAEAAQRAREAGFDGVEFLGSSGYLISQFFSPLTNKREDKYGGNAVDRAAFILSILKETRNRVGSDFNICVKFDADDGMTDGITLEDSLQVAPRLVEAGADRLHIWAGWHESIRPMLQMTVPRGAFSYLAAEIKKVVSVPVAAVGRINNPYVAANILRKGEADLIGLGRALLSDPEFVKKTMEGRIKEIRFCNACCYCFDQIIPAIRSGKEAILKCAVNPELGREGEALVKAADKKKRLIVAGGGPAGMEAARVAAIRGHHVTLYEKESKPGGLLNLSFIPPHKEELKNLVDYYINQMELLKIELKTGCIFTLEELERIKPDALVIATGAESAIPDIPGIADPKVVTALDVLKGHASTGEIIVVIGGGMIGLETAEFLADMGRKVTVVEMFKPASDVGLTTRWGLISRIRRKVKILTSTEALEITERGVNVLARDKSQKEVPADTVVIAAGMQSRDELKCLSAGIEHYIAGSCREPGQIAQAIDDGFSAGCKI